MENANDTAGQEKIAGTNLTTVPEYANTALVLADLENRLENIVYTESKEDMERAKKDFKEVQTYWVALEKTRKEIKAPALDRCNQIDSEAARLNLRLHALGDPIKAQIDAQKAKEEAERIAKAQAEQARIDTHKANIQRLRDFPLSLQGRPAEVIASKIEAFAPSEACIDFSLFEEFAQEARDAYGAALGSAREILQRQREHEAEQERVRKDRELLEAQGRELEQLRREKEEAEAREQQREREAQEQRELVERQRVDAIRKKIDRIKGFTYALSALTVEELQLRKEMLSDMEPDNAGYDEFFMEAAAEWGEAAAKIEHALIARRQADEEAAKAEQQRLQRESELAAERSRQEEVERQQRAEAERLERERAAHAAEVEKQRIANLGLMEAVQAVADFYRGREKNCDQVVLDLIAVWEAEPQEKRQAAKPVKIPRKQA